MVKFQVKISIESEAWLQFTSEVPSVFQRVGQDVGARAALALQSSLTSGVIQSPVPPIQSGGCPDVASSRRHLNSRDGNSRGHPRSSGGRQRSATRRGKTGAPVTRQGREQALVGCTPLSPHLSLPLSPPPPPPLSSLSLAQFRGSALRGGAHSIAMNRRRFSKAQRKAPIKLH